MVGQRSGKIGVIAPASRRHGTVTADLSRYFKTRT